MTLYKCDICGRIIEDTDNMLTIPDMPETYGLYEDLPHPTPFHFCYCCGDTLISSMCRLREALYKGDNL